MSDLDQSLTEAFELIEKGNLDSARSILDSILEEDQNNIDVWWLYVHATDNPQQAQKALQNVKRLDPNYPGLDTLSAQLNQAIPLSESKYQDKTTALDEDFELEEDASASSSSSSGRRIPILPLAMIGLMIAAIVIIFAVMPAGEDKDAGEATLTPEPTNDIFLLATVEVTLEVSASAAEITSEPTSDDSGFAELALVLDEFILADIPPEVITSDLGSTLVVYVCSASDTPLRDQITNAMVELSSANDALFSGVEAMAISIRDCDNANQVINVLGVALTHARSFVDGEITEAEFRSKWRVVS